MWRVRKEVTVVISLLPVISVIYNRATPLKSGQESKRWSLNTLHICCQIFNSKMNPQISVKKTDLVDKGMTDEDVSIQAIYNGY